MNIFELFGMIAVNNKGANQAIDQTGKKANTLASTMGKAFDKVGKFAVNCGKTMAKGLAVGTAAMAGLVVKGMNLAGELEQNMGGADAVFGEYADSMKKKAADAYKVMGLSQSEYLATANKMGSLLKGSGYEAGEAADMTAEAMQRAADVASIMGLDIGAAMESIAGAAKGNFTMMDNLGVAINDTTLKNYALEKGIKKSTAQMTTQEKVGLAMKLFLEKTADYANNYAKENDTLAGSLTTAKAAFQDFLSGAGDADALTDALFNAVDVIIRKTDKLVPKLVEGTNKLIKNFVPRLPGLIQSVLPGIIDGAVSLLSGLAQAIPGVWSRIVWPVVQKAMKFTLGIELPKWEKVRMELRKRWDESGISEWAEGAFGNIKSFVSDLGTALGGIITWATGDGSGLVTAIGAIAGAIMLLANPVLLLASGAVLLVTNWENVKTAVDTAFDSTVSWLEDNLGTPMENFRTNVIEPLKERWGEVKQSIRDGVTAVGDFLGLDLIGGWDEITNNLANAWQNVCDTIASAAEELSNFLGLEGNTGIGGGDARPWYVKAHPERYGGGNGGGTDADGSHANGLDFVPFDNYIARLHYGETVLTRKDADAWRKGSTGNMAMLSAKFDQMQETFIQVLEGIRNQPIAINIDSKAAAVLMAKEMTKSIGNRNIQALMGMGG